MNPAAENARRQLASAGRRKDFARRLGTGLAAGSLLLLAILLVALVDYWLMLPPAARWTALILIVGLLVAGLVRLVRVLRHPTDLKEAALDVEAQSPDLGCEVSTAAEYLTGQKAPSQAYEAEIADALEARAARAIERKGTSYNRRFLTPFVVAGVVVLLGLVGFLVFAPASGTAFLRTAAPWSQASFTLLEVHPQGGEYPVGLEISLTNVVSGRPPKSVEFQWKEAGSGRWARVPLVLQTHSVAFHTLLVSTSGVYRVLAGDAVSPEYRIDAYIPPKVDTLTIGLTPPAYTRIPPSEQTAGEITVLRGAKAFFRVGGNVPLGTAALEFTNGTSLALKPAGSNLWTADLVVTNDTDYAFVLTDAKGRAGIDHTRFHIQALPDHPPKVDIAEPGEDIRADPTDIVPLKVVASDDFGVESIRIVYHKLGEPEKVLEVRDRHVKDGETLAAGVIRLEEMNLKPFEVVAYHAEARDNNTFDGPGIGRSPTYFIEITDRTSPPPSKRKGPPQQKLNLLAIQKGIVADTTALPSNAPTNAYVDLAQRQRDAREFAEMYRSKLEAMGAPFAAQGAMESAVEEMGKAAKKLALKSRGESLPAEEKALAHLYEAVKAMPQLKNLPTKPTEPGEKPPEATPAEKDPVSVVLEEMRKKPKEVPNQKELEEALKEARELARAQGELAAQMERPQKGDADGEGDGKGKGPGEGKEPAKDSKEAKEAARLKEMAARAQQREASGKSPGELAGKPPGEKPAPGQGESGKDGKKGQGQGQAQEEGKGKGQGKGSGQGQPTPGEMAAAEQKMSEKAKALAEKVKRLVDKESRQGQGAGKRMEEASRQMAEAAKALQQGNQPGAGSAGAIGAAGLNSAADLLEKAISGKPELSDVSAEEAPKKFEGQISDYFKRLTRAE